MKIKAQLPRRLALLLAILTLASAVLVGCGKTTDDDPTPVDPKDDEVIVKPEPVEVPVDFAAAQKKWPDVYACIRIPGATRCAISDEMGYFIAQHASDDGYYLYRDLDGKDAKSGTLYTEKAYNKTDFSDPVTVIYGHNMANRTMFGGLQTFLSKMDFSQQHLVYMYQKDRRVTYQIVGGVQYDLSHIIYYHDFSNDEVFNSFFDQLWKETDGTTNLDRANKPVAGDKVLILSVCKNGDDNHRYLVVCKMIEDTADPTTWPVADPAADANKTNTNT